MTAALSVDRLSLAYEVRGQNRLVLRDVSLAIAPGEAYGLVGESGCGKSTLALAAMRYLPVNAHILAGGIAIAGRDLFALSQDDLRRLRAQGVAVVTQDPARALNPAMRIGAQIGEIFRLRGLSPEQAAAEAVAMLAQVRIVDAAAVAGRYPHQLSGGMQQRVAIAMALASRPGLLILDEPTTGLDATVEAEILDLIRALRRDSGTAILFISHDLAVVAGMCDGVGILYAGALIEEGPTETVFAAPRHPYTVGLLRCLPGAGRQKARDRLDTIPGALPEPGMIVPGCLFAPRCGLADARCRAEVPPWVLHGAQASRCFYPDVAGSLPRQTPPDAPAGPAIDRDAAPILRVRGLGKSYGPARRPTRALGDIALDLWPGETLGLVGESGSGKTTLARLLLGLAAPDAGGEILLDGETLAGTAARRTPTQKRALQIVFQNPDSALNRAHDVRRLIGRALIRLARVPKPALPARLKAVIDAVRLTDRMLDLKPTALSGGLKQRVAIGRAFAGEPRIVVLDEPTSALDVSVQASILNLLADLQAERRTSYVFISHDLATIRYLSDRIAVLYRGRLLEIGPAERVFTGPHHPYTASLLGTAPMLPGDGVTAAPGGCVFQARCPRKLGLICETDEPALLPGAEPGHELRCHIPIADL